MLNTQTNSTTSTEEHVFLVGRPPIGEYLGMIASEAGAGKPVDLGPLADDWRNANDRVRELEKADAGAADGVSLGQLPAELEDMAAGALADPCLRRAYAVTPWAIAWIELDRLVVFQKRINLVHVRRIQERLRSDGSAASIFRLCIPVDEATPITTVGPIGNNVFMVASPSNDIRVTDVVSLLPEQVQKYDPVGPVSAVIAVVVGFTVNHLSVVSAEGRLVLLNGSHRAYALRELGVTHVPCVVRHLSRREELPMLFAQDNEVLTNPDAFLQDPRPPLLRDFFDDQLRTIAQLPTKNRQIRVGLQHEATDVPTG